MKQNIKLSLLDSNTGQVPGLPANPRIIKDKEFKKLVNSIMEDPEMLDIRELMVYPFGKRFIIIGGNMRLQAIQEVIKMPKPQFDQLVESKKDEEFFLSWLAAINLLRTEQEIPCKIVDRDTPIHKLTAYLVKDNVAYGSWDDDVLANEFDLEDLEKWGVTIKGLNVPDFPEEQVEGVKVISKMLYVECPNLNELEDLLLELQSRGFECYLKEKS